MDQSIRDLFAAARSCTYLNTAAVGPLPEVTVQAVTAQLEGVAADGSKRMSEWFDTMERVREIVASMLKVESKDVGFTRNTSDGLGTVASGIEWKPGDNIVSFAHEFPANYYPWRRLRDEQGVELRLCPERGGRFDLDELCGLMDGRTRLVSVSAVQYSSGFRADLERVGDEVSRRDALFAVDIIQAFGALPLDLPACRVDIAAGAGYTWLCAPHGCGILYLNDRARERVRPAAFGWLGVEDPWNFHNCEQPQSRSTAACETGMSSFALLYGLEQSLKLLRSAGVEKIAAYLTELTDFLCEIVPGKRYSIFSSRTPSERSQIVTIEPRNGMDAASVTNKLLQEDIIVSERGGRVRIAPHIFNNFADIERFAACLP